MREKINKENWLKYADAVDDYNPIHRSDEKAREFGLEGAIAPGMYVASFLQKLGDIREVGTLFLRPVKDGDEIEIDTERKRISRDGKTIIRLDELVFGDPDEEIIKAPEFNYVYDTNINLDKVSLFLESINLGLGEVVGKIGKLPGAYLRALSASALLNYGKEKGKTGIHVYQSTKIHFPYCPGELSIGLCEAGELRDLESFELFWLQDGEVIASGEARVKPLEL